MSCEAVPMLQAASDPAAAGGVVDRPQHNVVRVLRCRIQLAGQIPVVGVVYSVLTQ